MKHDLTVTLFLVAVFFLAQIFGLYTISKYITVEKQIIPGTNETEVVITHPDTIVGPPPEVKNWGAVIFIGIAIAFGTILVLLLVRFKQNKLWKLWFFLAVTSAVAITLYVYFRQSIFITVCVAAGLAAWKIIRPNIIIHNLTEVLMYAGIAVLFVSLFNVVFAFVMLALISIYDMFAVWQSKHMVTLAQFQVNSKAFAGLFIPYISKKSDITNMNIGVNKDVKKNISIKTDKNINKKVNVNVNAATSKKIGIKAESNEPKNAILGGGDITFPLIFTGVVMEHLIQAEQMSKTQAFLQASIVSLCVTIALFILFTAAKRDKFYPAMPFLSAGCVVGYLIVLIL